MEALEKNILKETIVGLMERGADKVKIEKASGYEEFTVDQLEKMNEENGMEFDYDRTNDILTITKA